MPTDERRLTLAADATVRTYVGDDGWSWVVTHRGQRPRALLDLVDRLLVELADGTRADDELRRAAERVLSRPIAPREADERLSRLVESKVLDDPASPDRRVVERQAWPDNLVPRLLDEEERAAMRVRAAPVRVGCDGGGSCCRLGERVALGASDVAALQAAWPDEALTPGGLSLDSALRAERDGSFNLGARAGACLLLEADGRCGAQARLGVDGKPAVCRAFPLRDVFADGELVVGLGLGCRCAIDFAERGTTLAEAAAPLVARRRTRGEVEAVAGEIGAAASVRWPRARYLDWRRGALERAAAAGDAIAFLLGEARAIARGEAPAPVDGAWVRGLFARLRPVTAALAEHFSEEHADARAVYAGEDLLLVALAFGARAARRLADLDGPPARAEPGERLLASQAIFTHDLLRARALTTGLTGLALRAALARADDGAPLPVCLLPLSTVEHLFREQGGAALLDRFGVPIDEMLTED